VSRWCFKSVAKLARTWPLLFGQPFDAEAVIEFARGAATAGFGTSRGMRWRGPRPTHVLEDGAPLAGASAWTVINTPGHTDDSVAFWHNDSRTLQSGDAVITMRGATRFAPDTVDDVAALKTAARLLSLPVEHLLPRPRNSHTRAQRVGHENLGARCVRTAPPGADFE
jgi:glyoxylase-like metal-dependent hydrolase (beta-lactamase superfamily II)